MGDFSAMPGRQREIPIAQFYERFVATLRALGMSRSALTTVCMMKSAFMAVGGSAIAVAIAVLASPLMPLGLARIAEPDFAPQLAVGESVAVNGACMTVVNRGADWFVFEAGPESLGAPPTIGRRVRVSITIAAGALTSESASAPAARTASAVGRGSSVPCHSLTINGAVQRSGAAHWVQLGDGEQSLAITVTSPHGTVAQTYTLTASRAAA